MIYQSYEQIKQLELNILDELLTGGDAQERVWAAWEIGLRLGKDALPDISLQAHEAPDPGTRRHMIVVLAGLGHYSVLSTLAFYDPDESVRGTTAQYIIKITDGHDTEKISLIIKILEKDKSPVVKHSILANWSFHQKQIPIELLLDCALNKSEDVRKAAIEQIVKQYNTNELTNERIVDCLANQMTKETINIFSQWLLNADLNELIILSAGKAQQSSCLIMLDFLADKNLNFSWALLKDLSKKNCPDIDIRILNILVIEECVGVVLWLAHGIDRAIKLQKIKSHTQYLEQQSAANFHHPAINHFLSLINKMPPQQINPPDIQGFKTILKHLENDLNYFSEYDDEDYWEDEGINPEEYVEEMNLNCSRIKEWLNANAL